MMRMRHLTTYLLVIAALAGTHAASAASQSGVESTGRLG